jgi:hypothetical protein
MTTVTIATTTHTILALDLGKYKTVAYPYDPATTHARFDTLSTSRKQLRRLFARLPPRTICQRVRST